MTGLADDRGLFLRQLADIVPLLRSDADETDGEGVFPDRSLGLLRDIGALSAPLPTRLGGLDLGVASQGMPAASFLRLLGSGSIAAGRLLEGHVNALRLIGRYGDETQLAAAARDAAGGHLFGIWVTETGDAARLVSGPDGPAVAGSKSFCSGAGRVTRPLLTLAREDGPVLALAHLDGSEPTGLARSLSGVRGARTADMDLSGVSIAAVIGAPGDYLRQPEFSAGAWRGSAVALGGLDALVAMTIAQLEARGRHTNPHQAARIGRMLIAAGTARSWVARASRADELGDGDAAALVNLARIAVESACLDAIGDAQRALGLAAFVRSNPVERMSRDLATYLRQPAPDETLTEAALWFAGRGLPPDGWEI